MALREVGRVQERQPLDRPRRKWKNDIEVMLKTGSESVNSIQITQRNFEKNNET
jgi:hypothetical protein